MTDPNPTLTAVEAAEALTRLARTFERAFVAFGAPAGGLPPAELLLRDRAARLFGAHAATFAGLVPESVLLAHARAAGEQEVPAVPDDLVAALRSLDTAVEALASRAGPVADGALRRSAVYVRADLAVLRADLDVILSGG